MPMTGGMPTPVAQKHCPYEIICFRRFRKSKCLPSILDTIELALIKLESMFPPAAIIRFVSDAEMFVTL